jgi:hypothetical protein
MTKTVPITEKGNGKEVCRLADGVDKRRSWDNDKPGGARTSGFRRDCGDTSFGLSAKIWVLTKPKSQSVGQTCTFETDSRGSDEICSRCTGKGSLRAERPPEFEGSPQDCVGKFNYASYYISIWMTKSLCRLRWGYHPHGS